MLSVIKNKGTMLVFDNFNTIENKIAMPKMHMLMLPTCIFFGDGMTLVKCCGDSVSEFCWLVPIADASNLLSGRLSLFTSYTSCKRKRIEKEKEQNDKASKKL